MQTEKVTNHIVKWLKEYATNAGVQGFVIGISGGIDSAVTSTLCAETGYKLLCLEMPIHQDSQQVNRAQEHIAQLEERYENVRSERIELTPVFEAFKAQVPSLTSSSVDLSLANTRARLRMTTLYYFAGIHHLLVCGTGNKVEDFGVGFFTKYGDGGVDVSPIADLLKSDVYKIGEHLKVPTSILQAPPTDGLFGDARTDEDQIGASYDELEWAMLMQGQGKTAKDFGGRTRKVMEIYEQRHRANLHKMRPIPICEIPKELMNLP
ncbi:NAD(+) synthase [Flavobacteriaceae bacterium F08102]|nr:NAD(+) synthase [Flavobacteriaceae bacterium F08102]